MQQSIWLFLLISVILCKFATELCFARATEATYNKALLDEDADCFVKHLFQILQVTVSACEYATDSLRDIKMWAGDGNSRIDLAIL